MIDALIAQAGPGALDAVQECTTTLLSPDSVALNCGSIISQYVSQNWEQIWQQKIGSASPEFLILINISRYIAAPMVGFWGIFAFRAFRRNGMADGFLEILPVVLLVYLLYGTAGAPIRQLTLAARSLINYQNATVLEIVNTSENFESHLAAITDYAIVDQQIIDARSQCNGLTRNEDILECLKSAEARALTAVDEYRAIHGNTPWTQRLGNFVSSAIQAAIAPTGAGFIGIFSNSLGSVFIQGILAVMNGVIQSLVELSWLLTAIIAPIPIAVSIYPGTRGFFMGWVVAFLSLGMFKINLNIATSLIVSMLYNRGPGDILSDLFLLSLGVVLLALGMTAGGGLVLFNGISSAVTATTLGVLNLSTRGLGSFK